MGVRLRTDGITVRGGVSFDGRYEGAFGIAHGGAVSVALDEALGSLAMVLSDRATVTASLDVRFARPVPLGRWLELVAWRDSEAERKLWLAAELRDGDGSLAQGSALIVQVGEAHLATSSAAVSWWREQLAT